MSNRPRFTFYLISLFILIDWITKFAIMLHKEDVLTNYPILYQYSWGKFFLCIAPTFNEGAAFGLFAQYKAFLFIIRVAIIIFLLSYLFFKKNISPTLRLAFILLCAGAIGNLGDMIFYKHVIDFISIGYKHWVFPTFNLADIFISLGTLIFVGKLYFPSKQKIK
ncbi:signal peptidase II [Chlamydia gallinacea]|uniref:signal peptidase II n=1 Tax=Chlamydia gallinacea TaxID=1457153 RepID=UPI0024E271BE|nr:signal peptidase II [Chlamydia gallinacea]